MVTKRELVHRILTELIAVQDNPPRRPANDERLWLPPMLPVDSDQYIRVNDQIINRRDRFQNSG